ncbi:hypothetical protein ACFVH6_35615 [Spirillospora sp. NPDC127200]
MADDPVAARMREFCRPLAVLKQAVGDPSLKDVAARMPSGSSPASLSTLLNGKLRRPPRWETLRDFVTACAEIGAEAGRRPDARLLDLDEWAEEHRALTTELAALRAGRKAGLADAPPPPDRAVPSIADLDAFGLGLHIAINPRGERLPPLTPYVRRPHDDRLAELLARTGGNRMVVAVGHSSTGKTRALYEALRSSPDLAARPLLRPFDAAELSALPETGVPPGSVLWLDELAYFLGGADGPAAAAALRRLLAGGVPVLVAASLWQRQWDALVTDRDGPVAQLLTRGPVDRVMVPTSFQDADPGTFRALDEIARSDSRIAAARRAARDDGKVIQVLSGGTRLLERYLHELDPRAKAVITVALHARRAHHPREVPIRLLEAAVPGYLTGTERVAPDGWLEEALERAMRPVHGVRALEPVRTGAGMGAADAVVPHDYLVENVQAQGRIEASLWEALVEHRSPSADPVALAKAAEDRAHHRVEAALLISGWRAGSEAARERLTSFVQAHEADPVPWLRVLAEDGEPYAYWPLAVILQDRGDVGEALVWWRKLVEQSNGSLMHDLCGRLVEDGLAEQAAAWLRPAADQGDHDAVEALLMLLDGLPEPDRPPPEDKLRWWRKVAENGRRDVRRQIAQALTDLGDLDGAERIWTEVVDDGSGYIWDAQWLIARLAETGRTDEAESRTLRLFDEYSPGSKAARRLAAWLAGTDWAPNRPALLVKIMACAEPEVLQQLAAVLDEAGRPDAAARLRQEAVARNPREELRRQATALEAQGRLDEAERLLLDAPPARLLSRADLTDLIDFYERHDRVPDAVALLEDRHRGGRVLAGPLLVDLLVRHGLATRRRALGKLAGENDAWAMLALAREHRSAGEAAEAERWFASAIAAESGGQEARRELTDLLREQGRAAEALGLWRADADAFSRDSRQRVRLLLDLGRAADAERLLRTNLLNGMSGAKEQLCDFLRGQGRAAEAEAIARYGLEPDDGSTAAPWSLADVPGAGSAFGDVRNPDHAERL